MRIRHAFSLLSVLLCLAGPAAGQTSLPTAPGVPRLVKFSGTAAGQRITFSLYASQTGGAPLWTEPQTVHTSGSGHYTVLLGATQPEGLPAELFRNGEARWVGVAVDGQAEQERVPLVSTPYAVEAHDVDTVGGLPPSAFLRASPSADHGATPEGARDSVPDTACGGITSDGTATANQLGKFTGPCTMEPSAIFESGGKVGIGTTTPAATLDVKGTATLRGSLTMSVTGVATAAAGATSNPLDLLAASFNSGTAKSISQHFRWQAEAAGNDTSNPSGTLNLLYAAGSATPARPGSW